MTALSCVRSAQARLRSLAVIGLLAGLFALLFASGAQATTGSGHQNPTLAVTVSGSPNTVHNGDVVTATETVKNTSSVRLTATVTGTLTTPDGRTLTQSKSIVLKPQQAMTEHQTYTVSASDPRGTYTLRLDATNRVGTSSATARVTYA
jgi:uncharacterized protein (DUF58 family)